MPKTNRTISIAWHRETASFCNILCKAISKFYDFHYWFIDCTLPQEAIKFSLCFLYGLGMCTSVTGLVGLLSLLQYFCNCEKKNIFWVVLWLEFMVICYIHIHSLMMVWDKTGYNFLFQLQVVKIESKHLSVSMFYLPKTCKRNQVKSTYNQSKKIKLSPTSLQLDRF